MIFIIYKILLELNCDFVYVGSTSNLNKRIKDHKQNCVNESCRAYTYDLYKNIRLFGGFEKCNFEIIENYDCENRKEALIREQYWINELKANLNTIMAFNPKSKNERVKDISNTEEAKEKRKEYLLQNKDRFKERDKKNKKEYYEKNKNKWDKYREEHREQLRENNKINGTVYYTCGCGSEVCILKWTRHERTLKHKKYLETL